MAGLVFLIFYVLFKQPFAKRKIQTKFPKITDYQRDILYSIVSIGIFTMTSLFSMRILAPYTNLYDNINAHSKLYYGFTFVWMFFLHDAYFYWMHRLIHHPKLFKIIHLVHHKSNNPSPWTAYAFHPLEAFLESFITVIFVFTIPLHRSAIVFYMIFQIMYNIYGHLGYEILPKGAYRHWLGKWFNTAVAHNMHHQYSVKNYGLWTTIWDRMFGTMHEKYDEAYINATEN
jgi:sterol desaturase/sphingolipid hydroxylase (fatty acid hydroxylase superfamily)